MLLLMRLERPRKGKRAGGCFDYSSFTFFFSLLEGGLTFKIFGVKGFVKGASYSDRAFFSLFFLLNVGLIRLAV